MSEPRAAIEKTASGEAFESDTGYESLESRRWDEFPQERSTIDHALYSGTLASDGTKFDSYQHVDKVPDRSNAIRSMGRRHWVDIS